MKFLLLLITLTALSVASYGQSKLNSRIGVVNSTSTGGVCVAIQNSKLKPGQRLLVVLPDRPQSVQVAFIKKKVLKSCSSDNDVAENASFYLVRMPKEDVPFVAFGFFGIDKIAVAKGTASADINGDGKKEYFRSCTSNEGVHLTVWTGKPLVGKRIWHSYYYLSYDTEPDCKKKDYEGTDE